MDTEKTLDLNKPLFSYSRYERNEYGYGDDFIHRDGDGVDMQVFFNQATGEFVSKGVSISDFTNLVEGKSARDTNAWTRHSLDPKELLPDDISKVEINDGMMAFLKTYRFNVSDEHTGDPIRQEVYDFDFKAAEKGKRAKMQPKARLDAKKTCVDEAMRVMREQTDISGDKAKCARITDISLNFSMRPKDESLTHDGENTNR